MYYQATTFCFLLLQVTRFPPKTRLAFKTGGSFQLLEDRVHTSFER
ncbi:hypothetical protein CR513_01970 [Mucuna pruriens]|uniref:Uncharacterized protein n=1 Tax=Mucuna pruriens TaxID=157652 RepID=A0A371IDM6_MUCPR|nr:hypothetical protein CR513_01970 [Mucuna pruriens]